MKPTKVNIRTMLRESNLIEGVEGHWATRDAFSAWEYINKFDKLNNAIVQETHKILMRKQPMLYEDKGRWRKVPVWIGGVQKAQPPLVIDLEMKSLIKKINTIAEDPIKLHVEFEHIHPFIDGNGRMGRIIMNWHSLKRDGKLIVFLNDNKQDYYKLF